MSDFLPAVVQAFQSLLDKGLLKVETSVYDREAFGNGAVVLSGGNLRIRMIRDRGQVFAEAASCSLARDWFPLQMVLRAVGVNNGLSNHRVTQTRAKLAEMERVSTREASQP